MVVYKSHEVVLVHEDSFECKNKLFGQRLKCCKNQELIKRIGKGKCINVEYALKVIK